MSNHKASLVLLSVFVAGCIGLALRIEKRRLHILKVAIVEAKSGEFLAHQIEKDWDLGPFGLGDKAEVQVYPLTYAELYGALTTSGPQMKSFDFDVVMLHDPWLAELVQKDLLEPVPIGMFEGMIKCFVPEFLRVCFYEKGTGRYRRPPLDDVSKLTDGLSKDQAPGPKEPGYKLYALPYLGNGQMLASHSPNPQLDQLMKSPNPVTWDDVEKKLGNDKFFSRLATNYSAVADFLPILWSKGGCLVGWDEKNNKDVSGLASGDQPTPEAVDAFKLSVELGQHSPDQYARFDDQDVFASLTRVEGALGISLWTYRADKRRSKNLQWHLMPQSTTPLKGNCAHHDELPHQEDKHQIVAGHGLSAGVLGAWLLAVPKGRDNSQDAWTFIKWVLKDLSGGPGCATTTSKWLGQADGQLSPFECALDEEVKMAVRTSTPRLAHPKWHEIEDAVGFRIREAHWKRMKDSTELKALIKNASIEVQAILDDKTDPDNNKH